jgi:outer membrane phospholipase A
MKKWIVFLIVMMMAVVRAAEITPVLVPAGNSVVAGSSAQFTLVYLNPTPDAAVVRYPAEVTIEIDTAGKTIHEKAFTITQLGQQTLKPGEFGQAVYQFQIPTDARGNFTLKLRGMQTAPVVLAATPPNGAPALAKNAASNPTATQSIKPTAPASTATNQPSTRSHEWLEDPMAESFAGRFSTYQPMYLIAGTRPTAKIQLSLKYKIFDDDGRWAEKFSPLNHLYIAYTQTSFWDVASPDPKFTDNSYKPELMFSYDDVLKDPSRFFDLSHMGMQGGYEHESNGTGGIMERSMNILYVRPIFTWDLDKTNDWFISVAPRVYAYLTTGEYDHNMSLYRGYGDVRVVVGQRYGPQLALVGRVGEDFNRGALELDFSQPLRGRSRGNLDLYFYAQFFTGFGEQLTYYDKSTTTIRVGMAFVR